MNAYKDYLVEYQFQGVQWGATVKAISEDEAKKRMEAMGAFGRVKGEIMATVPGIAGPFVGLWVRLANLLRKQESGT